MKILQHCNNESMKKLVIFIQKHRNKTGKYKTRTIYVKIYRNAETPVIAKTKLNHCHKISAN